MFLLRRRASVGESCTGASIAHLSVFTRVSPCSISGEVPQGGMLALMGPSGCGKSSLLNVLSARFNGEVSGQALFNGKGLTRGLKRRLGYVLQEDILASQLTVRETLQYTARLRLPTAEMSTEEKLAQACAHAIVPPLMTFRLGEQRHRCRV